MAWSCLLLLDFDGAGSAVSCHTESRATHVRLTPMVHKCAGACQRALKDFGIHYSSMNQPRCAKYEVTYGSVSSDRTEVYKRAARISCKMASLSKFLASSEYMPDNNDAQDKVIKSTNPLPLELIRHVVPMFYP